VIDCGDTIDLLWASGSDGEVLKATDMIINLFSIWHIEKREKAANALPESAAGAHLLLKSSISVALFRMTTLATVEAKLK